MNSPGFLIGWCLLVFFNFSWFIFMTYIGANKRGSRADRECRFMILIMSRGLNRFIDQECKVAYDPCRWWRQIVTDIVAIFFFMSRVHAQHGSRMAGTPPNFYIAHIDSFPYRVAVRWSNSRIFSGFTQTTQPWRVWMVCGHQGWGAAGLHHLIMGNISLKSCNDVIYPAIQAGHTNHSAIAMIQ